MLQNELILVVAILVFINSTILTVFFKQRKNIKPSCAIFLLLYLFILLLVVTSFLMVGQLPILSTLCGTIVGILALVQHKVNTVIENEEQI